MTMESIIATYGHSPGKIDLPGIHWQQLNMEDIDSIDTFANYVNTKEEPCKVIYLAAYHHPDEVLENFDYAWNINITGLSRFLTQVKNVSSFYYASTEMVCGESILGQVFSETDEVHPLNAYGEQKLLAEKMVLAKGYNVVRFSVLMGFGINGRKHFSDKIVEAVRQQKTIEMLNDTYRNMIDFDQASYFTLQLMEKYQGMQIGIVHIVGDDLITKYDMAIQLIRTYGLDISNIKPIKMENNTFYSAQRAQMLCLSNYKLKRLLGLNEIHLKF